VSSDSIWIPVSTGILSLVCVALSLRAIKRRRIIDDTPTSKTTGVFIGMVELSGCAITEQPLTSYLAELECVHYSWSIEEHWEKTVLESYKDSNGKTQWRTRTESGWETIDSGGESIPFFLQDDHGKILVHPEGADLQTASVFSETCTPDEPLYFVKGPGSVIPHSTHQRRFNESAIAKGANVYLIGQARERSDVVAAEIAKSKDAPLYVISVHGEKGVRSSFGWSARGWFLGGALLAYGTQRGLPGTSNESEWFIHSISLLAFTGLWLIGWALTAFNSITALRRRVEQAGSNVDVMLKRRNDLIPSLVSSVQGAATHEAELQETLARLRNQANHPHESCAPTLLAIAESHPILQSDTSFLALQTELTATETRIALARAYYTEIASFFNTRTELIPDRWICKALPNLKPFALA
jgi:hypothetical protein